MELNAITTEAEYEAALKEVERLFELDIDLVAVPHVENLFNLIEAYEDKNYAIPEPNIVNRILYFLESRRFLGVAKRMG